MGMYTDDVAAKERLEALDRVTGRVQIGGEPRGMGFLVTPSVLLTDAAALPTETDAARGVVEFGDGSATFALRPDDLFATHGGRGITLVAVAAQAANGMPLADFSSTPTALSTEDEEDLRTALAAVREGQERPYYDPAADTAAREQYYAMVDRTTHPDELFTALSGLVESTHVGRPRYQPSQQLYPWVDLHPDKLLRSIYSGATFTAEELIRADARVASARRRRWTELLREPTTTFATRAADVEAELLFNCEHVVPQSWFRKAEPMRGDLHHLFACEPRCNSFRGNTPYFDYTGQEGIHEKCGRSDTDGFEPVAGKGPVARATLYFLVRYPGLIGDAAGELTPDRLDVLLSWHEQDPVSDYERHRNAAIAKIQGNRNPFVDDPELARLVNLRASWTTVTA
ncbi:MAG: endonuclease I family protein [Actinophytocola sp.]|uniref:endonuclease I family protein n=1 Tax=Actinophytocola sp. TaxID=1872138 RepID=UPI003D6A865C